MAIQTRSATSSPTKLNTTQRSVTQRPGRPIQYLVLPSNLSSQARTISLSHPRDGSRKRFLFCPEKGLFEYTKVSSTTSDPKSILLAGFEESVSSSAITGTDTTTSLAPLDISSGYISENADLLIATPFDIILLLLPLIHSTKHNSKSTLFQPLDDLLESGSATEKDFRHILLTGRKYVETAMSTICDTMDAGDEQMFRLNEEKLLALLIQKARRAVSNGLPSSLEEKFVSRALETPILSIKRDESLENRDDNHSIIEDVPSMTDNVDSQSSSESSSISTLFSAPPSSCSESTVSSNMLVDIFELQRLRIAFRFITSSYLSTELADRFQECLVSKTSPVDFTALDVHMKHLASLQSQVLASRSMGDYSRKRSSIEDDEAIDIRAEKRKKQEEEDKRKKATESRGVRDLKKVNVSGMKKMSDFFSKPSVAKTKA